MKTIFFIKIDHVVDLITNSSSELFILKGDNYDAVKDMISDTYPDWRDEYELTDINDMSIGGIKDLCYWLLGRYSGFWESGRIYSNPKDYKLITGFKFDELYDTSKELTRLNSEYEINEDIFTEENRQRFIDGIINDYGQFFLESLDDNPDYDHQCDLEFISSIKIHLG